MAQHQLNEGVSCPHCATRLDGATNADAGSENPPKPGDFTVCIYCGTILVFEECTDADGNRTCEGHAHCLRVAAQAELFKLEPKQRRTLLAASKKAVLWKKGPVQ